MNLLRIRAKARKFAGNVETADYSNADIDSDINEGKRYIDQKIVEINQDFFEEQKSKFNLVASSSLYSLPTDFLRLKQVRIAYTTPDSEDDYRVAQSYDVGNVRNVGVQESNIPTNNPIVDITNNYMRIEPVPTSDITNGGELYYIARPSALVLTSDSPVFPEDWHFLLAKYAAKEICTEKAQWERKDRLEQELAMGIQEMQKSLNNRELNKSTRMVNFLEQGKNTNTLELWK